MREKREKMEESGNLLYFIMFFVGVIVGGLIMILPHNQYGEVNETLIQEEIVVLEDAQDALFYMNVPDSLKQLSQDASYTLQFAEYHGGDYWMAMAKMHIVNDWIEKNCSSCVKIREMIKFREIILEVNED